MMDKVKAVIFGCVFGALIGSSGFFSRQHTLELRSAVKGKSSFVIVFSYMRSGSSFVGELFRQNKDVFYIYEPLQLARPEYLNTRFNGERIFLPNLRHVNSTERQKQWVSATLENVYNCQLSNITGIDTTCVADLISTKQNRCPRMSEVCARSQRKATKLVRTTMEEIQYFLSRNKHLIGNIKIVHLLRDPRGRLNSHLRYHEPLRIHHLTPDIVSTACERQMKDVRIRKQLEEQFPGTFLEIRYEDVASDPVTMSTRIYHFLYSEDVPDKVKQWIKKSTKTRNGTTETMFNTVRGNPRATSLAWRHQLSAKDKSLIDRECNDLLQHMRLL